ncbi:MAG: hypothetical protein HWQ43_11440 [Nostoc sp. JL31]|uniref:hypothetical protein n=1 Tax=Nostoc sp. JL31 TaxID=2815395 RepID=UPI0025CCCE91|nr:hypothetical protein [Nostoc sp. JL31]MBN3889752.1 hypothetical protein [Nostoc sp. JL31]
MEPLTASAIATLVFTKMLEKTIEKFTEATLAKIKVLRDKIWNKFRVNQEAVTAFVEAEKGSSTDLDKVAVYLQEIMKSDLNFAQEVEKLVGEIQQEININKIPGQNVQNIYGGEAQQNNAIGTNAPVIQGGSGHNITFN